MALTKMPLCIENRIQYIECVFAFLPNVDPMIFLIIMSSCYLFRYVCPGVPVSGAEQSGLLRPQDPQDRRCYQEHARKNWPVPVRLIL